MFKIECFIDWLTGIEKELGIIIIRVIIYFVTGQQRATSHFLTLFQLND